MDRQYNVYIIGILLLIIGILSVINSNYFNIKEVEITGNNLLTDNYVLNLCNLKNDINIFKINRDELVERLFSLPQTKGVIINRDLPNKLSIDINERRPLAIVGDDSSYRIIDVDGWVLRVSRDLNKWQLPLINGIAINYYDNKVDISNQKFRLGLNYLNKLPRNILQEICEVDISDKEVIKIFLMEGCIVKLENDFNIEKKASIFISIYNDLKQKQKEFKYIDLRYDDNNLVKIRD